MKSAVLLPLICAFLQFHIQSAFSEELLLPLDSQQEECIKELNLDRETIAQISTQEFPPEDNSKFNEFFSCTWKKQGYQQPNGQINYTALENMIFNALAEQAGTSRSALELAKQMATESVNVCKQIRGNSHGQIAVKMQNCVYKKLIQFSKE